MCERLASGSTRVIRILRAAQISGTGRATGSIASLAVFGRAAKAQKKTIAQFLREAGRKHAGNVKRRAACLDYPDWPLSEEAERDKDYLVRKFKGQK